MTKRPILVVDDDPTILATVSDALDMEGFSVLTATNGAEALDVCGPLAEYRAVAGAELATQLAGRPLELRRG
jgi:CheY-like chemotaxis protein